MDPLKEAAPEVVGALAYIFIMMYGLVILGTYWASIRARDPESQDVSEGMFTAFGLIFPIMGWGLSFLWLTCYFVLPVSLLILYIHASSQHEEDRRLVTREKHNALAHAEHMIEQDDKNAAGHWARAEALEHMGRFQEALKSFRRAHELCTRTVSATELADIEDRLRSEAKPLRRQMDDDMPLLLRHADLTGIFLFLGIALLFWKVLWGMNVAALMLFVRWLYKR